MRHVDAVHTVSELEAKLVKRDFNVDAVPIENGVDEWVASLTWSPSGYVMYSGRIERYKNIHRLANIVRILNAEYGVDLEFKIFGAGPYSKPLEKYLGSLGIRYSINPPQPFERYIESLSKASLFGLLSERESYPQSVNEANAIGVPVIVAEPWGLNFRGRRRTLITRLQKSDGEIADEVAAFLDGVESQPKSDTPTWSQVVELYINKLYRVGGWG